MYDLFHARGEVMFMVAEADVPEETESTSEDHKLGRTASSVSEEGDSVSTKRTVLSAAMFMTYGDEVIYLFSGSDEKYMRDYNAQYLIQYHLLKFPAANHYKIYNFYGINGLPDENSKDYGIYEFKKGFGGHVVELIGSFELSLSKTYTLAKKIRH
jgi:lipid II:glycine glycyltransferase (peptidoglycan interpeptide bridge formation enzyme)